MQMQFKDNALLHVHQIVIIQLLIQLQLLIKNVHYVLQNMVLIVVEHLSQYSIIPPNAVHLKHFLNDSVTVALVLSPSILYPLGFSHSSKIIK